jgi:hypothetical protein
MMYMSTGAKQLAPSGPPSFIPELLPKPLLPPLAPLAPLLAPLASLGVKVESLPSEPHATTRANPLARTAMGWRRAKELMRGV